jgi:hypothetical protein
MYWKTQGINTPPTVTAFLYYEKAFIKVIRNELWPVTIDKSFPQHLINTGTKLIFGHKKFER